MAAARQVSAGRSAAGTSFHWQPVPTGGLVFSFVFAGFIAYRTFFNDGWVPLVDDANFAVHEAGHPLIGVVSGNLSVYGGTLTQLLFPAVCMFEFARRRWTVSAALCGIWFGQSLLSVARYLADARAMELPLKGFSEFALHDWNVILSRWGLLTLDTTLANGLRVLAWLAIICALGFLVQRWRQTQPRH
jgi:hypothetical protein